MTTTDDTAPPDARVEQWCEIMHDAYEHAAVGAGWETNPASRKPWPYVPEANKATMRAAVRAIIDHAEDEHAAIFRPGTLTFTGMPPRLVAATPVSTLIDATSDTTAIESTLDSMGVGERGMLVGLARAIVEADELSRFPLRVVTGMHQSRESFGSFTGESVRSFPHAEGGAPATIPLRGKPDRGADDTVPSDDERRTRYGDAVIESLEPWLRRVFSAHEDPAKRRTALEVVDCIRPLVNNPDHFAPVMAVADAERNAVPLGLDTLADEVWAWHVRELGEGTAIGKAAKVGEEAGELIGHVIKSTEPRPDAAEHWAKARLEVADVILAALGAARALGFGSVDELVLEKWATVRERRFATAPKVEP